MDAAAVKPAESYPKEKIAAVDLLLEGIAKQKETDDRYSAAIASADKLWLGIFLTRHEANM